MGGGQVAINGTGLGTTGLICRTWMSFDYGDLNMYGGTGGVNVETVGCGFGSRASSSVTVAADLLVRGDDLV